MNQNFLAGSSFGFAGDSFPKKGGEKGGKKGLDVNQKMDQSASLMVPLYHNAVNYILKNHNLILCRLVLDNLSVWLLD